MERDQEEESGEYVRAGMSDLLTRENLDSKPSITPTRKVYD
jgi:hypothetical protein